MGWRKELSYYLRTEQSTSVVFSRDPLASHSTLNKFFHTHSIWFTIMSDGEAGGSAQTAGAAVGILYLLGGLFAVFVILVFAVGFIMAVL